MISKVNMTVLETSKNKQHEKHPEAGELRQSAVTSTQET